MTQYPRPITQRLQAVLPAILTRLTKLESRTAMLDSTFPLAVLPGVIDAAYTGTGDPMVTVNGAATLSGPYQYVTSYTPAAGDSVLLVPVPALAAYVIIGKLSG
jgi:hypothetical protein